MKLRLLLLATASAAAVTALNAQAISYGNYELAGLVGSGSNTSVCVFDFGSTTTHQYAFGYAYDGTKTGADLLMALNDAPIGVSVDLTYYEGMGYLVNSISYMTYSISSTLTAPYQSPCYWTGNSGTAGPTAWTSSSIGISSRVLTNGTWDGFSQGTWVGYDIVADAPSGAFAAVPEPAALSLLALGGLALLRRRR
jgi:hypothetical protein